MMKRQVVLSTLQEHLEDINQFGVKSLALFFGYWLLKYSLIKCSGVKQLNSAIVAINLRFPEIK